MFTRFVTVHSAVYGQFVLFYIMCPLHSKYYANVGTQALGMYDTRIDCIIKKLSFYTKKKNKDKLSINRARDKKREREGDGEKQKEWEPLFVLYKIFCANPNF